MPPKDFEAFLQALWRAEAATVQSLVERHPHLLTADELLHTAARPPGHEHNGHGGVVPPEIASDAERASIVRWLVENGTDPNQRSRRRRDTALHAAARYGLVLTIDALLALGADPNMRGKDKATPLHRACNLRYRPAANALLAAGGDPTLLDNKGNNANHYAGRNGWEDWGKTPGGD